MAQAETVKDVKKIVVDLTMTVEEARNVFWKWNNYNEPIGALLDAKKVTYRDLAGAVMQAWDPKMRAAARTLLAYWLGQPATLEETQRFGPQVITGTNYLKEQELDKIMEF